MLSAIALTMFLQTDNPIAGKKLVFSDEFANKGPVDTRKWHFDDGAVYNNELQDYTGPKVGNAFLQNKRLVIEARKTNGVITSARLTSRSAWKYGYFEAKMKVPAGRGTWPAFWMLGDSLRQSGQAFREWPLCGEIDIMEFVGFDPTKFHFSLHTQNFNHMIGTQITHNVTRADAVLVDHVFGVDWSKDWIRFYVDGMRVFEKNKISSDPRDWPFDAPFYMILNLAIGGMWGGQQGVDDAIFPSRFSVDYVRVYQ